jgi:hypothetical protein
MLNNRCLAAFIDHLIDGGGVSKLYTLESVLRRDDDVNILQTLLRSISDVRFQLCLDER